MKKPYVRFLLFILMFVLVVILPWWVSVPILFGLTIYYNFYLEVIFFGFLFDLLYSVKYTFPSIGLSIAMVFLLIMIFIKTQIRT
ncbi:MAG: hypothetical protein ABL899_02495 [Nitrospira sp.]